MQGLGMEGGQFLVQLYDLENPAQYGHEDVQFLVAGHAGSSPKPIGKVASGGELSRIALALSVVNQESGNAPTVIFDEVDSGVGGAVAESVGKLMQKLANARQVLAVTHLPQVAAYAAPGGYIFITSGMLTRMNSEAELAGVLAHEVAHVVQQHHLKAIQQQAQTGLLSDLATADFRTFTRLSPPLRSEADRQAVRAALADGTIDVIASGHDPRGPEDKRLPFADAEPGMAGAETLLALGSGAGMVFNFLSARYLVFRAPR